ncbi:MAG: SAM-dependent methyltransferase [Alphaproteobacteria bacterium]|nr:SAM-dependent methyltransferase [Alphaproteobacteria bacterium]
MPRTISYDVPGYEAFRQRAKDDNLRTNEKVGFPESLRAGASARIFADIEQKLTSFSGPAARILDIGPGCGELARHVIAECVGRGHELTLIDSPEMLDLLPDTAHVTKLTGPFPACLSSQAWHNREFDAILVYSVVQYVFSEGNLFSFIDAAAALLAEGGQLLVGDIPNATMRKRFLASPAGREYHRRHYASLPEPEVTFNSPDPGHVDDGIILGILARMRLAGFHAYVMPQADQLPMATRREDILIRRP